MKNLLLMLAVLILIPVLRAQQAENNVNPPQQAAQIAPQQSPQDSSSQNSLPPELRPGHPLDPADVDVLTGKRDRELEASRRPAVSVVIGNYGAYGYGTYGDPYLMNGRRGTAMDLPLLPLRRIANPFFFFDVPPGGFGRRGFRGAR